MKIIDSKIKQNKLYIFVKDTLETIVWALVLALVIRAFLVQVFWIPSSSMEPTLNINDRVIVSKLSYGIPNPWFEAHKEKVFLYVFPNPFYERHLPVFDVKYFWDFGRGPKRFDIIVFKLDTPSGDRKDLIKRVIGLPGERLQIKGSQVYINDEPLVETHRLVSAESDFGPVQIPLDAYFMLGDNRPASADSRYWGFLPKKEIVGPQVLRIWPLPAVGFVR